MKPTDFAYHLTNFLSKYLPGVAGLKDNTITSYANTFTLLLRFCKNKKGIKEQNLTLSRFNRELILDFLAWIENERGCCISTRNQRLAAIHSFFIYLQDAIPAKLFVFQEILSISAKKTQPKLIDYLTTDGIECLLSQISTATKSTRKHLVIITALYASAARVSELVDVTVGDIRFGKNGTLKLTGKKGKSRIVPIEDKAISLLTQYLDEFGLNSDAALPRPLFLNHQGNPYSRQGITHVLHKYADIARQNHPKLIPETLSPHCLRHSKAMHMLQAGVNLVYIRDFLGHEHIKTTEIYAKLDAETKRRALEKMSPIESRGLPSWQKDDSLLDWLNTFK